MPPLESCAPQLLLRPEPGLALQALLHQGAGSEVPEDLGTGRWSCSNDTGRKRYLRWARLKLNYSSFLH